MKNLIFTVDYTRADWVKRFAYRAMLCRNEMDTESAMLLAVLQFDGLRGNNPEAAAECLVGRSTFKTPAPVATMAFDALRRDVGQTTAATVGDESSFPMSARA